MNKYIKIPVLCTVIFLLTAIPVFSQNTIDKLQDNVNLFSETIVKSLPFSSTMGLNWSDAYIGQLFDLPPHFGIGVSAGFTTMPIGSISDLAGMFGYDLPDFKAGFPLPGYTVEARGGGIILPFDIGVKFGIIPESELLSNMMGGAKIKYQLFGADLRYSLINSKVLPVKLSIGLGYNYLSGGISKSLPIDSLSFDFYSAEADTDVSLAVPTPDLGILWKTNTMELKAQISFPLVVITPYAGAGISWAWSEAGYQVKSKIQVNGADITDSMIEDLKGLGVSGITDNGFESILKDDNFNMRLFGGFSLNITVLRIDLTAMYNVMNNGFGFTVGTRFQL
ncbi:MAG: hypothetical protein FWD22_07320 [Treponema sp.]|nr:hypothetical protein [Treponema sp.]